MSAETIPAAPAVPRTPLDAWRRDRRFFTAMAVAALLTVFAGFARSYYLRTVADLPADFAKTLPPLVHLHGLVFTTWIVLYLVQTRLVAGRKLRLHRRLGYAAIGLALLMVAVGFAAAVSAARRGPSVPLGPGAPPPLVFLAIPLADLVVFSALVGAGVWFRNRADTHKRLMLMSTISILTPAIARIPGFFAAGPLVFFGLTDLFVIAGLVYDKVTRGRVHPAYWWAGGLLLASQVGRLVISGTSAWLSLATWLTR